MAGIRHVMFRLTGIDEIWKVLLQLDEMCDISDWVPKPFKVHVINLWVIFGYTCNLHKIHVYNDPDTLFKEGPISKGQP